MTMLSKKNILIFGPIADFGGREVEVNFIAKALRETYNVQILSTGYMTENSFAIQGTDVKWNSVFKIFYDNNLSIKGLSFFSKLFNRGNKKAYGYVNNAVMKRISNLNAIYLKIILKELQHVDAVILCTQLSSQFLPEVIGYCHQHAIPVLLRTTGTIREIPQSSQEFLKKVTLFVHHSLSNANRLNKQILLPFSIIDQSALFEKQLLDLPIKKMHHYGLVIWDV